MDLDFNCYSVHSNRLQGNKLVVRYGSVLDMSSIAIGSYSKYVFANYQSTVNLVVAANVLPYIQASYVFVLSCGSSSSSIVVSTNAAPLGGSFIVSPSEGEELSTILSMTASQWMDVDLPLSYQFV